VQFNHGSHSFDERSRPNANVSLDMIVGIVFHLFPTLFILLNWSHCFVTIAIHLLTGHRLRVDSALCMCYALTGFDTPCIRYATLSK
jgi:hypothetical protein